MSLVLLATLAGIYVAYRLLKRRRKPVTAANPEQPALEAAHGSPAAPAPDVVRDPDRAECIGP
jgi:hypothetical protein